MSAELEVRAYDPRWPELFRRAEGELRRALGEDAVAIEHVGSTAVPGLPAKPVIDIAIAVRSLSAGVVVAIEWLGYEYVPEYEDELPNRRYFHLHPEPELGPGHTGYHVHVYAEGDPDFADYLRFRDYLRSHPEDAAAYGELKLRLAAEHADDRDAYQEAKSVFVERVVAMLRRGA
jgi:GrpB-like predicted nucleotidyltransferase (UPF0157 family)